MWRRWCGGEGKALGLTAGEAPRFFPSFASPISNAERSAEKECKSHGVMENANLHHAQTTAPELFDDAEVRDGLVDPWVGI